MRYPIGLACRCAVNTLNKFGLSSVGFHGTPSFGNTRLSGWGLAFPLHRSQMHQCMSHKHLYKWGHSVGCDATGSSRVSPPLPRASATESGPPRHAALLVSTSAEGTFQGREIAAPPQGRFPSPLYGTPESTEKRALTITQSTDLNNFAKPI